MTINRKVASIVTGTIIISMIQTGCVSFSLGEAGSPNVSTKTTRRVSRSNKNEIDEIRPVVQKDSSGAVMVSFNVIGSIEEQEDTKTTIRHGKEQRLAFGFFPGAAADKNGDAKAGTAAASIWYNILFLGLPTVSGLLVEPFVHAEHSKCSHFSRSAIFGFHRWAMPEWEEDKHEEKTKFLENNKLSNYTCIVGGEGVSRRRINVDGDDVVLRGIKPKDGYLDLTLEIPKNHPLEPQLAPFAGIPIKVEIK